mmetsp:Transcript_90315/g.229662  ORF Transcript_90315/g.229662 Transcript_90315/m.229662 type:complete len:265 (+) Transcript_90315:162-956(+)
MPYGVLNHGFRCVDTHPDGTNVQSNKIFVGGMAPHTTRQNMMAYFGKFGRVMDCLVVPSKGRSPCIGFVDFDGTGPADAVVRHGMHQVLGRWCEVRKAVPDIKGAAAAPGGAAAPRRALSPHAGSRSVRDELLAARQVAAAGSVGQKRSRSGSSSTSSSSSHKRRKKKKKRREKSSSSSSSSVEASQKQAQPSASSENPEAEKAKHEALERLTKLKALPDKDARMREWRALLREWHPDKNPDRVEVATAVFQFLQKGKVMLESD